MTRQIDNISAGGALGGKLVPGPSTRVLTLLREYVTSLSKSATSAVAWW